MPVLYGVTALVSVLTIFFTVALRSYVPRIVRVRNLVQSNSRLSMSESIAEIAGPPSATWLIQVLTAPLAIIFDALSFLFSAYCLWRIRIKDETETVSVSGESPEQADVIVPGQLWQEIGEGFAVLWRHPVLWMVALYTALFNFSGGTFATLYTLYIVRTLGLSYTFYGVLVALGGIGALLGSLLATPLACRLGVGRVMILGALLFGVLAFATPLAQNVREHSWLLLGMLMGSQLLGDCALMVYMVHEISWRQSCVPARFLGRVNACMHVLSEGIGPLGAILAALFCQWSGNIQLTLLLGACGMLIAACLLCYSPLWWIGELSTEEDSTAV
jgi:Na+/melibiose symporter-like transporter